MIHAQAQPDALIIVPCSLTAGSNVTANMDCIGAEYATIRVLVTNAQATVATATGATVSVLSSDTATTNATTYVTVVADRTALKFGQEVRYDIDMKGAKRYLRVNITAGTAGVSNDTCLVSAIGTLSRREQAPTSIQALVTLLTNNTNSTALQVTA